MIQNDDTISRQAAIDTFYEMASDIDHLCTVGDYVHVLEGLPSAQPEITRCKDCEHWTNDDCPFAWGKVEDAFCSYAERKTDE